MNGVRAAGMAAVLALGQAAWGAADHSRFVELKGPFKDGPAVTRACLVCHTEAGKEVARTQHWNWLGEEVELPGRPGVKRRIGKANLVNNFCIGAQSNEASCTRCHIGYGWKDRSFDFSKHENIDCLACHDAAGLYSRSPSEDEPVDLAAAARGVGKTTVRTCGTCHFNGGGGEAVKHGDLDPTLLEATRSLDVHLARNGVGFTCAACHRGEPSSHGVRGRSASVSVRTGEVACADCHGARPHGRPFIARGAAEKAGIERLDARREDSWSWKGSVLNSHAGRVACQTCHIPRYARGAATKMWWDWSAAGRRTDAGRPVREWDEDGNLTYFGEKGAFRWGKDLVPEYRWYDGRNERYLLGDAFDPKSVLVLNPPLGEPGGAGARIWPFKVHRGRQPYDVQNRILIQPKLSGPKGSGAYWADFDWDRASRVGMTYAGLPYSGKVGFAETEMWWPLSHMVVEGEQALSCADCHGRRGRLAALPGVHLPGQHRSALLDALGWAAVALSAAGAALHGLLRWGGGLAGLTALARRAGRRP
jgi:hypothetical protein